MKFVHIADLHLDMPLVIFRGNKELSTKRKLEQKFAFKKVIEYIKENNVKLLFIAGDLFEQKYVEDDTIQFLISCFEEIKDTSVYITPGNHDPLIKSSAYNMYEFPDNVYIFGRELGQYNVSKINIYGVGFDDYEMQDQTIKDIELDKSKINILIDHGTLGGASNKYNDIKKDDIKDFDYVALGHIHMPKVDDSHVIYPGSLTSCGFDEPGEHGMVVGEIHTELMTDENKENFENKLFRSKLISYKFVKVDDTEYKKIELDISNCKSVMDAINMLDINNDFYKIKIFGTKNIDTEDLKNKIKALSNRICEIEDDSHPDYDLEKLSKQDNLKGIFIRKMLKELEDNPDNKEMIMDAIDYVLKYV